MVAAADGAGAAAADDARPSFKRPTLTKGRVLSLQQPGHRYASFVGDDAALKKDWASLSDEQKEGLLDKIGVYTVADLGSLAWLKKVAGVLGKSEPDLAGHLDENTRTNEARYFDVLEWLGGGERPFSCVVCAQLAVCISPHVSFGTIFIAVRLTSASNCRRRCRGALTARCRRQGRNGNEECVVAIRSRPAGGGGDDGIQRLFGCRCFFGARGIRIGQHWRVVEDHAGTPRQPPNSHPFPCAILHTLCVLRVQHAFVCTPFPMCGAHLFPVMHVTHLCPVSQPEHQR